MLVQAQPLKVRAGTLEDATSPCLEDATLEDARFGIPLLENTKDKSYQMSISFVLIDMKLTSKILKMFYGDLHHFPVPGFDFSTFQFFQHFKT